ncbi:MAG TPA: MBL fold metallo-hydrolase [Candidatus Acidoferrales bacterium]|nr:MBL fold metallo-hydrolase [Candidatus Acidoferrales bacterium]
MDGRQYLIDCGIGTMRRMVDAGIQSETIGTIFITHHHPDHDLGLAELMANDFFQLSGAGATRTISIYGPPQTREFVAAAFRYISIPFSIFAAETPSVYTLKSPFAVHDIQHDGLVYQDDKVRVIAAENSHYALMPAKFSARMKSYSYRFETRHGVVVFTGDTGPSDAVTRLAKGADVLVAEVLDLKAMAKIQHIAAEKNRWPPRRLDSMMAHFKFEILDREEVGRLGSKAQVKSVVLYHLGPEGVEPAVFVSGVKKYYSGPVFASADLDRYCLNRPAGKGANTRILIPCR